MIMLMVGIFWRIENETLLEDIFAIGHTISFLFFIFFGITYCCYKYVCGGSKDALFCNGNNSKRRSDDDDRGSSVNDSTDDNDPVVVSNG